MKLDEIPILNRFLIPERRNGVTRIKSSESEREMLEIGPRSPEATLARLGITDRGLDPAQVDERRARFGSTSPVR